MHPTNLQDTQQLLWKLITAPEGAASGVRSLTAGDATRATSLVRGDERLSAIERVDVYADMYFYRLRDCLKDDFNAVRAVVGEVAFHNLVTDYLVRHPPTHFSLRYAGRHLPDFVKDHPLVTRWPYLNDLARLEWAVLAAFDARDAEQIGMDTLGSIPGERWPDMRFALSPSLQLLSFAWPVQELWDQVQNTEALYPIAERATLLRVWRQNLRVFHRSIDPVEHAALSAIHSSATFAEACELVADQVGEEEGAQQASLLLAAWIDDGLIVGATA